MLLTLGAAGGLLLLAWNTSFLLALLAGSALGWAWLMDWCRGKVYQSNTRLEGKLAVVTGANTGIGIHTARDLAARGARVVLACRDLGKGEQARQQIEEQVGAGKVEVMQLDLSSFQSVRMFAAELVSRETKLDILVNNAGIAFHPRHITDDGNEQVMQVNHLSPFLLTNLLLDLLKAAPEARVINLSSIAHKWSSKGIQFDDLKWESTKFDSWQAYGQSKLANIYFTRQLAEKLTGTRVTAYAVHPGSVATDLGRHYQSKIPSFLLPLTDKVKLFLQTPEGGAQTSIYCAVEPSLTGVSGRYYDNVTEAIPADIAFDKDAARQLWDVSKQLVGDISPLEPSGEVALKDSVTEKSTNLVREELVVKVNEEETKSLNVEVSTFSKSDLKQTVMEVKNILPDQEVILQERSQVELIGGIENFNTENLSTVTTKEPLSGAELLKQELSFKAVQEEVELFDTGKGLRATEVEERKWMPDSDDVREEKEKVEHLAGIEGFNKTEDLIKVQTKEPISGAEMLRHEMMTAEVENFDLKTMKTVAVEEKIVLPDTETLQAEKTHESFLKGVESFSHESLAHVRTPEPVSGAELVKQELTIKSLVDSVESFETSSLKSATTEEKIMLPDAETIRQEKDRVNLLKDLESSHDLTPVALKEPLSGAALLKQELTHKQILEGVSSFDTDALKPSQFEEKVVLPDQETIEQEKGRANLLKDLESEHDLTPVTPKEPLSGAALLKQELTHQKLLEGVSSFNQEGLKPSQVEEKVVLPDQETIQVEKTHMEHLKGIGEFNPENLTPVKVGVSLSGPEVSHQEILRSDIGQEVAAFNRNELKETSTEEKVVLPGAEDIKQERQHQDLLTGVETGGVGGLKHVETREPTNPLDLARMELTKDQVEEDIQAFDRARLTPVVTEEKQTLPSAEDIKNEALTKELDTLEEGSGGDSSPEGQRKASGGAAGLKGLLEGDRERRSSSEEWEKVSTGDLGERNSSEC